ncbi:amino acid synthesis family protein [Roseovarius sp. TE539]|uniref:amino acid synthesis family protein n=1 Tax=Roseovarius sp. TE539 TaxID=2249812 RepID=UPI000DE197C0|nr:amino acid synthesis family protein [Roseovarius sp. TE539]RBI68389.1 amino acid synthesis family protein [Roseovarius sp. TE539]
MSDVKPRKIIRNLEEIFHEGGPRAVEPLCRASIMAVVKNPFAGRYEPDIQWFMEDLKPLGAQMSDRLVDMLGGASKVEGYGKGTLIGATGEIEHGALWHAPGGHAMRVCLNDARAIVPSSKKVTGIGGRLDIPITHINASYVRSHFDSMEVGCNDAPRADELAFVLVMTSGSRVHARSGGLAVEDIKGEDGLR